LVICATVVFSLQALVTSAEWLHYQRLHDAAQQAQAAQITEQTLSLAQQDALEQFVELNEEFKPSRASQEKMIARVQESYAAAFGVISKRTWYSQTNFLFTHGLFDSMSMMLLGMALLRLGVLRGVASARAYALLAIIGYAAGLTVNLFETTRLEAAGFSVEALIQSYLTYDLGRVPTTLGHVGVIGLACRAGRLPSLMRAFAAVGRMALTNYLAQSFICLMVFTGAGLSLYGELERRELYYVVAAIWALELGWSGLWLRWFRFGPAEWLWRSLTYWRMQPMRRGQARTEPRVIASNDR
ncbi:MAG TPA: DUF418 domain-containing protein, partial [Steroidobacter sp.]|nr:DUF418 domain-containing protein [Steroidobacter sp.]